MSTYSITTSQDNTGVAPPWARWVAHFGDADEGTNFGCGATEAEAIRDLLNNAVAPWEAQP